MFCRWPNFRGNARLRAAVWLLLALTSVAAIAPVLAQQPETVHYEYDRLNRLTKVTYDSSGASIVYTFDAAGNRTATVVQGTNAQPVLASLYPDSISAGTHGFTLSVQGLNLINGAVTYWNGAPRTTTYYGAYVTIELNDADLRTAGTFPVSLLNPSPGGIASNTLYFTVTGATPSPTPTPSPSPTPTPSASPIELLLDQSGPASDQLAAVDSVLLLRDPFLVVNGANFFNQGIDRNTRIMIFATNLQLTLFEVPANVIVNIIDSKNQSYDVPAEDVRLVPGFTFTQVVLRLPDNLAAGTCTVKVRAHGQITNSGTIRIRNLGP